MTLRDDEIGKEVSREIEEELRFHIDMRAEDNRRSGMGEEEAARDAKRRFGDFARIAKASRYERLAPRDPAGGGGSHRRLAAVLDALRQDIVHTFRGFARSPGLFGAAVVTLAIGLGATTAIFSLANWVLLRPVPGIAAPNELSDIWVGAMTDEGSLRVSMLSYPNFKDVTQRLTTVSGLSGYQPARLSVANPDGFAEDVVGAAVTASYFDVLGVQIPLGRGFGPADDIPGASDPVAIISDRLWVSMFARDAGVLEDTIRLNGIVFTIVGVAPAGFHGTELLGNTDVWVPGGSYALLRHFDDPTRYATRERGWFYMLVARRAPGTTWDQVDAELASLREWLAEQFPEDNESFQQAGFNLFRSFGTRPLGRDDLVRSLALLMGVSSLVLLIACANVANLLLIRGLGRRSEVALRKAIGAGRGRLLRQHLTEGGVLWLVGGIAGLGVARLLATTFEGSRVAYTEVQGVSLDAGVVVFAATTALAIGGIFAAFPALAALRVQPAGALKAAAPTGTRRRLGTRNVLTAVQLSASLTLLVGTLLLIRTLGNLHAVDPGFEPDGAYTILGSTRALGYDQQRTYEYFTVFEQRLRLRPEITAVGISERAPLQCCGHSTRLYRYGEDPEQTAVEGLANAILTPGFFDVYRIPLLGGRVFDSDDIATPGGEARPVVVMSESYARKLFGTVDAVGRFIAYPYRNREGRRYEVIGVVGDVHYGSLSVEPEPMVYEPAGSGGSFWQAQYITVRTTEPLDVAAAAREIGASLDAALPVGRVVALDEVLADARSEAAMLARLMSVLAACAATLAAVGLYGVVAFAVSARSRELGIRIALGAEAPQVFWLVLRSIAGTTAAGLVFGLGGAMALVRVLESRLYGVAAFDAAIWALAAVGLVTISLAAAALPARRATRVDPVEVLRST